MMNRCWIAAPFWLVAVTACEMGGEAQARTRETPPDAAEAVVAACTVVGASVELPDQVRETSGLAQSLRNPAVFWTHNDAGNGPELFAIDSHGQLVRRLHVAGAEAADWEDIESGACDGGSCLFIGDIGDNDAERTQITIYRIPEPAEGATASEPAVALHARYPGGPRDAESLFHLASGDLYLVTKGRGGPIELYRFPAPQVEGETAVLEKVRQLLPEPADEMDRVTAATASPDGRWVGIRTYRNLYLYRADELIGSGPAEPAVVDLTPLGHEQGESLVISEDGAVWVSSEAANKDTPPEWGQLQCTLPNE